jgi:hypothetical protein
MSSPEDWARETARMPNIDRNGHITIVIGIDNSIDGILVDHM